MSNPWDKKQEPVLAPIKQEVKVEEKKETPQTFVIKTELDAYISERLQTQPKTLEDIKISEVISPLEGKHKLSLPKEIKDVLDKGGYTPYWINKKKQAIDHALNDRGWSIFNRVLFPSIHKHNFTANGTVEIGDCILGFMPTKRAERLRTIPGEISSERVKNLPMDRYKESKGEEKIGYYKPAYSAERDGEVVRTGQGLFAQPDVSTEN